MKRIISVLLSLIIITACSVGYAEEMGAEFNLLAIDIDTPLASNMLNMNITLPDAVDGGTLIVAFYTDGECTKVVTKDVSTTNKISLARQTFTTTPNEIKLMLWEKDKLRPLASAQDALTQELRQKANARVLNLLDGLSSTSKAIRSMIGQSDNSVPATQIRALLDPIDTCITNVKEGGYIQNHLLTSEYCNREFSDEIENFRNNFNNITKETKDRINAIYLDPQFEDPEKHFENIKAFIAFLNIGGINLDGLIFSK